MATEEKGFLWQRDAGNLIQALSWAGGAIVGINQVLTFAQNRLEEQRADVRLTKMEVIFRADARVHAAQQELSLGKMQASIDSMASAQAGIEKRTIKAEASAEKRYEATDKRLIALAERMDRMLEMLDDRFNTGGRRR